MQVYTEKQLINLLQIHILNNKSYFIQKIFHYKYTLISQETGKQANSNKTLKQAFFQLGDFTWIVPDYLIFLGKATCSKESIDLLTPVVENVKMDEMLSWVLINFSK